MAISPCAPDGLPASVLNAVTAPLIVVSNLEKTYATRGRAQVHALAGEDPGASELQHGSERPRP